MNNQNKILYYLKWFKKKKTIMILCRCKVNKAINT